MRLMRVGEPIQICTRIVPPILPDADGHLVPRAERSVWRRHGRRAIDCCWVRDGAAEDQLIDAVGQWVREGRLARAWASAQDKVSKSR